VSVFLARTRRWAIVGSETRYARAISPSQPVHEPQGQRDPRLRRERRMAGHEDQPENIVSHGIVPVRRRLGLLLERLDRTSDLLMLALLHLPAPEEVDGAAPGGGHEPRAGLLGEARRRPLLERGHQRVLRQVLRDPDVADDARESADDLGGFDPPDRVDRSLRVGHAGRLQVSSYPFPVTSSRSLAWRLVTASW
jgi:hypothetical protein